MRMEAYQSSVDAVNPMPTSPDYPETPQTIARAKAERDRQLREFAEMLANVGDYKTIDAMGLRLYLKPTQEAS